MNDFKALNKRLAELYPDSASARRLLDYAGMYTGNIDFGGSPVNMWFSILDQVEKHKKLHDLLKEAHDEYPEDEVLINTIQQESEVNVKNDEAVHLHRAPNYSVDDLKSLVAKGKLNDALNELAQVGESLSTEFQNNIVLLQSRLSGLMNDQSMGIISRQDFNMEKARIIQAINYQIDEIPGELELKGIVNRKGNE